jgi:hypothetical protein
VPPPGVGASEARLERKSASGCCDGSVTGLLSSEIRSHRPGGLGRRPQRPG